MGSFARGYRLEHDSIDALLISQNTALSVLRNFAEGLDQAVTSFMAFKSFQGAGADACKAYYQAVYGECARVLFVIALTQSEMLKTYAADLYQIDSGLHARIQDEYLEELYNALEIQKFDLISLSPEPGYVIRSIQDIIALPIPSADRAVDRHMEGLQTMRRVAENLHRVEDTHRQADFRTIDDLIDALSAYLDMFADPKNYLQPFCLALTKRTYETAQRLDTATLQAGKFLKDNQEKIARAQQVIEQREKDLVVEQEEREEQAAMIKAGVEIGACLVMTVASVAIGPGVLLIVAGGVVGAGKYGMKAMADEMVVHGNLSENYDEYNWQKVGGKAILGGVLEAGTTALSVGFDSFKASGQFAEIFGDSNSITGLAGECAFGLVSDTGSGIGKRFIDSYAESGDFMEAMRDGVNPIEIRDDLFQSFTDFGVSKIVELPGAISDSKLSKEAKQVHDATSHFGRTFMEETGTSVFNGIKNDTVDALQEANQQTFASEEERKQYILDKVFDPASMIQHFGTGAVKGTIKGNYSKNELDAIKASRSSKLFTKTETTPASTTKSSAPKEAAQKASSIKTKAAKTSSKTAVSAKKSAAGPAKTKSAPSGANKAGNIRISDAVVRTQSGEPVEVKIESTGNRTKDIRLAEKACQEQFGINARDYTAPASSSVNRARWFVRDESSGNSSTRIMQLVDDKKTSGMQSDLKGAGLGSPAFKPA